MRNNSVSPQVSEKVMIRISGIHQVTEKRVQVILQSTGERIWLPISEAERFGNRVFIPSWLAGKYKELRNEKPLP